MTSQVATKDWTIRWPVTRSCLSSPIVAALILGAQVFAPQVIAGVPEVSGPECVPVPGMPCPGSARSSSSGTSRSTYYSLGSRSVKPSNNSIILNRLKGSLDQMTTPNPATLQRIKRTQMEGAEAQQEAVQSQQTAEEQRRQKARRDAEAARMKQLQDLGEALQGLPGNTNSRVDLRPGGTPFFGQGGAGSKPMAGPNIEELREAASSGFDTRGSLAGQPLPVPPLPAAPEPVALREKPIPPEKITQQMRTLIDEREALREQKKKMQEKLEQFASKSNLTPTESALQEKLKQDLSATLNKEDYLTFTLNESLP